MITTSNPQPTLEEVQALGHESIEDAEKHDAWIRQGKERKARAKDSVLKARDTSSNIIDMR